MAFISKPPTEKSNNLSHKKDPLHLQRVFSYAAGVVSAGGACVGCGVGASVGVAAWVGAGWVAAGSVAAGCVAGGSVATGWVAGGSVATGWVADGWVVAGSVAAGCVVAGVLVLTTRSEPSKLPSSLERTRRYSSVPIS